MIYSAATKEVTEGKVPVVEVNSEVKGQSIKTAML